MMSTPEDEYLEAILSLGMTILVSKGLFPFCNLQADDGFGKCKYRENREGSDKHHNNMDDFYHSDVDRSLIVEPEFPIETSSKSDSSIYLKASSILFVRAGLFLSQVSSIPSSNIQILIFQNIIDIALNTVVYSLVGYLFAFGKDESKFIGTEGFLADKSDRNEFVEGWLIIIAVSGLLIAAIGDRISFFSSLVINVLISGLIFPIFIHWILSESGWMRGYVFSEVKVSYKDYSYSCLIHMSGGFLAFMSMLILNKRLLRFKDMDVSSVPDNGPSLTLFGNFFMIIGFLGIGVPTEKYILSHLNYNFYGIVLTNTLLSAFGAVTTTLLLTFSCPCEPLHKWTSIRSIQAAVSGIAIIAGGADIYNPLASLTVGICNGVLFFFVSFLVNISAIEDYSNIIACHFVSGTVGTLLPPLLGIREGFNTAAYYSFIHFIWQLLCDLSIFVVILSTFTPVTILLDYCSILRSWDEDINHRRALFASKIIKNRQEMTGDESRQKQTVNYSESEPKTPKDETAESAPEKLDVLFEKKTSDNEQQNKNNEPVSTENFSKTYAKGMTYEGALNFDNENYLVNYVLNSKPLTFFEEINSNSQETIETKSRDYRDKYSTNSRFFDIKMIKGIRNISDSKLFHKFKDNRSSRSKKRSPWNRQQEPRLGSASIIWVPSSVKFSVETQV